MIEAAAAFLVWLGAALVVLADGRRGLALGLALLGAGFAVLEWASGQPVGALPIVAGGLVGSARCGRSGATWGLMPAGSTPRLVLCFASGLVALWVAAAVTAGPGAQLRFAVLVALGLMGARALMSRENGAVLTSVACFALALAVAPNLGATSPGPVPAIFGGLITAGVMFLPAAQGASKGRASGS